ncbi:hypothetical protein C8R43DRAFT_1237113 [Mycena crocata]|nr:hypothetical protein C8R43DRAFT_1237113 [Mycena crocata]
MLCDACKHPLLPPDALPTPAQADALRQFLSSGALPLDPAHYQSQIATSVAGLARYDAEIGRVQETLGRLIADRLKLQEYADGLRAAMSPVRALPAEILGEIFTPFSRSCGSTTCDEELDNLAKVDLLDLSKVCSRWHRVILGTPRLWSDIVVDLEYWFEDHYWSEDPRFLHLLSTALERGAHHPLTLSFRDDASRRLEQTVSVLTLVAQYSQRWQQVSFRGRLSLLEHISHIKGKLDILGTLSLETWEEENLTDLFEIAPRLVSVNLDNIRLCPKLPWDQLHSLAWIDADSGDISDILGSIRKLSHSEATVELRRFDGFNGHLDLPAVTSTISSFLVELWPVDPGRNAGLAEIFACLTLPHLQKLFVARVDTSHGTIPWPVNHFGSLSLRSSFSDTLRVLEIPAVEIADDEIPAVEIADDELLRSLMSLGSLDRLVVADQQELEGLPEHVLVTDALLLRLTYTPDSQLIPNLTHLTCTSLFKFSANVYLDFVLSRIRRRAPGEEPFQCGLCHFRRTAYEFDPGVHQNLLELVERRELEFSIGEEGKGC